MSAVNFTDALKEEDVIQKPWTDEDHWTMYKNQQDEIYENAAKAHNENEAQRINFRDEQSKPTALNSDL